MTAAPEPRRHGIVPSLPFREYLAHPSYGSSDLRAFRCGPPALVHWRRKHRDSETPATRLGTAAHCAILTPDLFDSTHVLKPEGMEFRSKANKELRDAWLAAGRSIVSHEEWQQVQAIRHAFESKPAALDSLLRAMAVESSVFWTCEESGLPCKARPDWFTEHTVYDLKVSVVAERGAESLAASAYRNGWLHQLAHNAAGLRANGVQIVNARLVIIAPEPPQEHRVWLLEVRENDVDFLELDNVNTRRQMAVCHSTGHWPGTPDQWQTIEMPAWASFTESDLQGAEEMPV